VSKGPGPNRDKRRCATERVEGVTSLDILYTDFHKKIMTVMQSSDMNGSRSCGAIYKCPNGSPGCQTRYVLNMIEIPCQSQAGAELGLLIEGSKPVDPCTRLTADRESIYVGLFHLDLIKQYLCDSVGR